MQPKDKFSGKCQYQIKETYGSSQPTQPSVLTCEGSKGVQKVTSICSGRTSKKGLVMFQRDDPHEGLKKDLRRDPEGLYLSSESPSLVCLKENSENYLVRSSKCFSGTHLSLNPDREHLAKTLQVHLSRKVELMKEDTIPLCVRRSWLAANHASPKSNIQAKPIKKVPHKGYPFRMNTSQELSFLDRKSHLMLETHIVRYRVRHRWDPHMKALEQMNVNLSEAPASPLPQPAISSSADSITKVTSFPEEVPQICPGKKVVREMSVATLQSTFTAHSAADLQWAQKETTFSDRHVPTEAHPSGQEDSIPFQSSTCNLLIRTQNTVLGAGRGNLEPSLSPAVFKHEQQDENAGVALGDPNLSKILLEINVGSQPSMAKETRETVEEGKEISPAGDVSMAASMLVSSQIINVNLNSSESPGTSKSHSPSRISISQDSEDAGLKAQVFSEVEFIVGIESE
jgi:hypothetical protein